MKSINITLIGLSLIALSLVLLYLTSSLFFRMTYFVGVVVFFYSLILLVMDFSERKESGLEKKRLLGITIASILEIVMGAFLLLSVLIVLVNFGVEPIFKTSFGISFLYGVLLIIAGLMTLRLKSFGRILTLILNIYIFVIFSLRLILIFLQGKVQPYQIGHMTILMPIAVITLFMICFFSRSKIKEQFK